MNARIKTPAGRKPSKSAPWSSARSAELYGIGKWGNGYFDVNRGGEVTVQLEAGKNKRPKQVSLAEIIHGLRDRGTDLPVLLRFRDLLHSRISELNESFNKAIDTLGYKGNYRGVYPIKVNQQRQVIEEITAFGRKYHYGLEAGSKPELIAALAYMHDPKAYLICNGYKDEEFIDLALNAQKMGVMVVIVLEMPGELALVIERARRLDVRPNLGIRVRLASKGAGHWQESGGDKSVFGLNAPQIIEAVDQLKQSGYLDCLRLLHYHQGSQIPNIRSIREAATEAARIYVDLAREGAPMGVLDIGGGLAVDYDGSNSNFHASCNYSVGEYCADVLEVVMQLCDGAGLPHPDIISESGRAVVAYYSVLVFNILDVSKFQLDETMPELPADACATLKNLLEVNGQLRTKNLLECYNDAVYYRDQIRSMHVLGNVTLRERGIAENLFWRILTRISRRLKEVDQVPDDLQDLKSSLHDFYYGNFSLFQSLPDSWAIDQLFPVMPIHRLDEFPSQQAVVADITCDCDGKIDRFIDREDVSRTLQLHAIEPGEDYWIGVFLVGAYQETLGDLHNLLGDTNVVGVHLEDGKIVYTHEVEGDTVADVLSYVEYDTKDLVARFRAFAERAVAKGLITPKERHHVLNLYRDGLDGYTYFES
jgi:arginine decarboxylase